MLRIRPVSYYNVNINQICLHAAVELLKADIKVSHEAFLR